MRLPLVPWCKCFGLVLLVVLFLLAGCAVPPVLNQPNTSTRVDPASAARQALQEWIAALESGDCDRVLSGLARSVEYWNPEAMQHDLCQSMPSSAWAGMTVESVVAVDDQRVIFRVQFPASSPNAPQQGYAVMVNEDGQWRYAADLLRPLDILPEPIQKDDLQIRVGPAWERVDALTLVITMQSQAPSDLRWASPCARLRWPGGREVNASFCPAEGSAVGESWQGELTFPKGAIGREISSLPQTLLIELDSPAGPVTLQMTLHWLYP